MNEKKILSELLKDKWKDQERVTFPAPKGTKDLINKKVGRHKMSKFCREAVYKSLKD